MNRNKTLNLQSFDKTMKYDCPIFIKNLLKPLNAFFFKSYENFTTTPWLGIHKYLSGKN